MVQKRKHTRQFHCIWCFVHSPVSLHLMLRPLASFTAFDASFTRLFHYIWCFVHSPVSLHLMLRSLASFTTFDASFTRQFDDIWCFVVSIVAVAAFLALLFRALWYAYTERRRQSCFGVHANVKAIFRRSRRVLHLSYACRHATVREIEADREIVREKESKRDSRVSFLFLPTANGDNLGITFTYLFVCVLLLRAVVRAIYHVLWLYHRRYSVIFLLYLSRIPFLMRSYLFVRISSFCRITVNLC